MPFYHSKAGDRDIHRAVERVFVVDEKTPLEVLNRLKAKLIIDNPWLGRGGEIPVGEPLVVPETADVPTRVQPPTAAGILLRAVSALQEKLGPIAELMLAGIEEKRDDEKATLKALGKGRLKHMTALDVKTFKPILDKRVMTAEEQVGRLKSAKALLEDDLKEFGRRLGQ